MTRKFLQQKIFPRKILWCGLSCSFFSRDFLLFEISFSFSVSFRLLVLFFIPSSRSENSFIVQLCFHPFVVEMIENIFHSNIGTVTEIEGVLPPFLLACLSLSFGSSCAFTGFSYCVVDCSGSVLWASDGGWGWKWDEKNHLPPKLKPQ